MKRNEQLRYIGDERAQHAEIHARKTVGDNEREMREILEQAAAAGEVWAIRIKQRRPA